MLNLEYCNFLPGRNLEPFWHCYRFLDQQVRILLHLKKKFIKIDSLFAKLCL